MFRIIEERGTGKTRRLIEEAYKNNKTIKVVVKEEIKGGLAAYYGSIRVFIPASQASRERIELKNLLGKELEVKLIELDLRNRKVVASRRVIEEEIYNAHKKELWKNVKSGEKREGVVTKILKVGAIVDIGGITGLIHISDLAWEKVKRVEDVVSLGDKVVVFVGNVDAENEKVSLILKDVNNEPWNLHRESLKEGNVLEGKVAKLLNFGAFPAVFQNLLPQTDYVRLLYCCGSAIFLGLLRLFPAVLLYHIFLFCHSQPHSQVQPIFPVNSCNLSEQRLLLIPDHHFQ